MISNRTITKLTPIKLSNSPGFSNNTISIIDNEVAAVFLRRLIQTHHHESALSIKPSLNKINVGVLVKCDSIDEISEVDMEIRITLAVRLFWRDPRLAFDEPPYNINQAAGGLDVIILPVSVSTMLWIPDFFIEGSKKTTTHSSIHPTVSMRIFPGGFVEYETKLSTTSLCSMDLRFFPLDREACKVTFQSFGHFADEVSFYWQHLQFHQSLFENLDVVKSMPKFSLRHYKLGTENITVMARISGGH